MLTFVLLIGLIYAFPINDTIPPRSYFSNNGFLSPEESFIIDVNCGIVSNTTLCDKFKYYLLISQSLHNVALRIASDLLFKVPITVNFTVGKDPEIVETVLGYQMVPFTYMIAGQKSSPDDLISFPSALAKQTKLDLPRIPLDLVTDIQYMMAPYDITLLVKPDRVSSYEERINTFECEFD